MSVLRHYKMTARDGEGPALGQALKALGAGVAPLQGCEGVELYADTKVPEVWIFIERWRSIEAHKAAGGLLDKALLAPVTAALSGPPEGRYLVAPEG